MKLASLFTTLFAGLLTISAVPGIVKAGIIVDISEVGGDVVATGSGSINLTGLSGPVGNNLGAIAIPDKGGIGLGSGSQNRRTVSSLVGPASFGTGSNTAGVGTGDAFGFFKALDRIYLPFSYSSGAPLSGTTTWTGTTIAALGMTPGTHVWTWGGGADSFTVNVQDTSAVPEPSTLIMLLTGGMGLVAYRVRRKKRQA